MQRMGRGINPAPLLTAYFLLKLHQGTRFFDMNYEQRGTFIQKNEKIS
jgi:hypothetical protein